MSNEVTSLELLLTRARALRITPIVVEQIPSVITRAARVAAYLVVVFCTAGAELRAAAELLGITDRRQIEQLRHLRRGECVVSVPGDRLSNPTRLIVPNVLINRRNLSIKERRHYVQRSLADLRAGFRPRHRGFIEQYIEVRQRERDPNRLSKPAWRVFVTICGKPDQTIEERCAALGIERSEEEAGRRECKNKGYLAEAGTLGKSMKFFKPSPKGISYANVHNVPIRHFKSSVPHEFMLNRTKESIERVYPDIRWISRSGATGSVQADGYGVLPDGLTVCVQIHYHNKLNYEINRLMDLCSIDPVDRVLFIAPTKKAITAAKKAISKSWKDGVPRRYSLISANQCLNRDFDWTTVLGRPEK
jgi:hypothetical protein